MLFRMSAAWCIGVAAAAWGGVAWWPALAMAGLAFAAGCLLARRPRAAGIAALLTLGALAGVARFEAVGQGTPREGLPRFNDSGQAVTLRGLIIGVEPRDRSQLVRLRVHAYLDATGEWAETKGSLLVTARPFPELRNGDTVVVTGKIEAPQSIDGFDYRAYLERQGISSVSLFPVIQRLSSGGGSVLQRNLIGLRELLASGIEKSMPEPEASLAKGILLGQRGSIPADVSADFNRSGLSHLIAISGYNVMLVAGLVVGVLWPLTGRRHAMLIAVAVIVLYAVLVGGPPSVLRATLMAVVVLGADVAGRPGQSLRALLLTVAALTLVEPSLANDVSFQLSVAATGGIVAGARRLEELLAALPSGLLRAGAGRVLAEQLSVTAAASVSVLPVMALTFGRVSLVSLPANLLAGPAFVVVLAGSLLSSVAGLVDTGLARVVGEVAYLPLAYLALLARTFAGLPASSASVGAIEAFAVTGALVAAGLLLSRRVQPPETPVVRLRLHPAYAASAVVLALAAFTWQDVVAPEPERLAVTVLDVGQGDAILVELPGGRVVLVDGGPSGSRLLAQLGEALPASERRIDLVVLTHPQDDHVSGLVALLDRFDTGQAMTGPLPGRIAAYDAWRERLDRLGVPLLVAEAGTVADLGDGVKIEVLWPGPVLPGDDGDLNEHSVVLRLVYRNVSFLMTGDLGFAGEDALLDSGADLHASVLKVGHHGSDGSTSPAFLDAVGPSFAVISAGSENPYGHPSPTTRLRLAGIPLLRTDRNGQVTFSTDGYRLWTKTERGSAEVVQVGQGRK